MTAPTLKRQLCSKREAGGLFGVGPKIVRGLIKSGALKTVRIGKRDFLVIDDCMRLIEERKKEWPCDVDKAHHTGGIASASAVVDFAEARKKRPAKRPN